MRGSIVAVLILGLVGPAQAASRTSFSVAAAETPFDATYREAAEEFGIPYELVKAVAFAQTAHHHVTDDHHTGRAGVMGLTPGLRAEAASMLGLSAQIIATDVRANVRAGAAILADRRARELTWNQSAIALADLSSEDLRARWLVKYARNLKAQGRLDLAGGAPAGAVQQSFGGGEYPGSNWVPAYSGNYTNASRAGSSINYVIIHDVEGSYEGCISWFQNSAANVSAHYVVSNEGDITQMVREEDIAWHAGNWSYNEQSVGIEHEGYASDPNSYPDTMYAASSALTRYLTDKYSIPRTRDFVIAHVEVPGSSHTDPGPYWQWDYYMELIEGGSQITGTLVGYVRETDIYEGAPIAGATITLDNGRTATTDADGYYEIPDLELAAYQVTASAEGYETAIDTKDIEAHGVWWKSLALVPTGSTGEEPDVNPQRNASGIDGGFSCSVATTAARAPWAAMLAFGAILALRRRR